MAEQILTGVAWLFVVLGLGIAARVVGQKLLTAYQRTRLGWRDYWDLRKKRRGETMSAKSFLCIWAVFVLSGLPLSWIACQRGWISGQLMCICVLFIFGAGPMTLAAMATWEDRKKKSIQKEKRISPTWQANADQPLASHINWSKCVRARYADGRWSDELDLSQEIGRNAKLLDACEGMKEVRSIEVGPDQRNGEEIEHFFSGSRKVNAELVALCEEMLEEV